MEVKELIKKIENSANINNISLEDALLQLYRDNTIDRKLFRKYLDIDEYKFQSLLNELSQEEDKETYEDELFYRMSKVPYEDRKKYYENFRRHFND